jgi:selenocysteine lyase/cysteine desulfurase
MVAVPSRDAAGLCARLLEQDIVTSFRDNNLRATVHFYNSEADIDRFVATMEGHRPRFGPRS